MNGFDAWIGHDWRAIVNGEPHASALVEQRPGEVAADEAGATGHQRKTGREEHGQVRELRPPKSARCLRSCARRAALAAGTRQGPHRG